MHVRANENVKNGTKIIRLILYRNYEKNRNRHELYLVLLRNAKKIKKINGAVWHVECRAFSP